MLKVLKIGIGVLIIVIILFVALAMLKGHESNVPTRSTSEILSEIVTVHIPLEMKKCQTDTDCIEVNTKCECCENFDSLNKVYENTYRENFAQECKKHRTGILCNCTVTSKSKVQCLNHICTLSYDEPLPQ